MTLLGTRRCGKTSSALRLACWLQSPASSDVWIGALGGGAAAAGSGAGRLSAAVLSDLSASDAAASWPIPLTPSQSGVALWTRDSFGDGGGDGGNAGGEGLSTHDLLVRARQQAARLGLDVVVVDSRELGASEGGKGHVAHASVLQESDLVVLIVDALQGAPSFPVPHGAPHVSGFPCPPVPPCAALSRTCGWLPPRPCTVSGMGVG